MEVKEYFIYLAIMSGVTYLIRVVPFALVNRKIESRFIKSFLYYVPYAVLSAMTFPAILFATDYVMSAMAGLIVAVIMAYKKKSLIQVAMAACVAVLLMSGIMFLV